MEEACPRPGQARVGPLRELGGDAGLEGRLSAKVEQADVARGGRQREPPCCELDLTLGTEDLEGAAADRELAEGAVPDAALLVVSRTLVRDEVVVVEAPERTEVAEAELGRPMRGGVVDPCELRAPLEQDDLRVEPCGRRWLGEVALGPGRLGRVLRCVARSLLWA